MKALSKSAPSAAEQSSISPGAAPSAMPQLLMTDANGTRFIVICGILLFVMSMLVSDGLFNIDESLYYIWWNTDEGRSEAG